MSIPGASKLSGVQLSVIGILLFIIVIFLVPFVADKKDKASLNSDNQYQINTEKTQWLEPLANEGVKYEESQTLVEPLPVLSYSSMDTAEEIIISSLDDESLLIISDILENSLIPVFLSNSDGLEYGFEQKAAIHVFVSRLPEGLLDADFQQINSLLRDYLPYDTADRLTLKIQQTYQISQREQAYLSGALVNNKAVVTMAEQMAIAEHLQKLKGEEVLHEIESEPSQALSDWQKTQEKIEQIRLNSDDPELEIHNALSEEFGSQVADDYFELANSEIQWMEKYDVFLNEKNIISESGLSEEEKERQIESLMQQYFQENELDAARGYGADRH
tara:strand:+ start:611 stop:1606 length:996 start_codon:yes stop_codon:yes gene_type:complete